MANDVGEGSAKPVSRKLAADILTDFWAEMGEPIDPEFERALKKAARETAPAVSPRPTARRNAADPVAEAHKAALGAKTLPDLFAAIEAFPHCPLKAGAKNTVTHDGQLDAKVFVIGEGPGADEDRKGKPFVGRAGQLLDKMLASISLSRETNAFISNVNYWRPPNNADPSAEVLALTLPFARRMIALKQPALIIAVGRIPMNALLGTSDGIMSKHGRESALDIDGRRIPFVPIYHPAFLLRQPKMKGQAWRDLLSIEARLKGLGVL